MVGGVCPKCGGKRLIRLPGGLMQHQNNASVGSFFTKTIRIARIVCLGCGFTEEWVDTLKDMEVALKLEETHRWP